MNDEIKINCQHCDGPIKLPVLIIGENVACPHCNEQITLAVPKDIDRWHYYIHEKAVGPCNIEQIKKLLASKVISPATLIMRTGLTERQRIRDVPEFAEAIPVENPTGPVGKNSTNPRPHMPPGIEENPIEEKLNFLPAKTPAIEKTSFWWPASKLFAGGLMAAYTYLLCRIIVFSYIRLNEDGPIPMLFLIAVIFSGLFVAHSLLMAFRCILFLPKKSKVSFSILPTRAESESVARCLMNGFRKRTAIPIYCFVAPCIGLLLFLIMILAKNVNANPTNEEINARYGGVAILIALTVACLWKSSPRVPRMFHTVTQSTAAYLWECVSMAFYKAMAFRLRKRWLIGGCCIVIALFGLAGWAWEIHHSSVVRLERDRLAAVAQQEEADRERKAAEDQREAQEKQAQQKRDAEEIRLEQEKQQKIQAIRDAEEATMHNLLYNPTTIEYLGSIYGAKLAVDDLPEPNGGSLDKLTSTLKSINQVFDRLYHFVDKDAFGYNPVKHVWVFRSGQANNVNRAFIFTMADLDAMSGTRFYNPANGTWTIIFKVKDANQPAIDCVPSSRYMARSSQVSLELFTMNPNQGDDIDQLMVKIAELIIAYGGSLGGDSGPASQSGSINAPSQNGSEGTATSDDAPFVLSPQDRIDINNGSLPATIRVEARMVNVGEDVLLSYLNTVQGDIKRKGDTLGLLSDDGKGFWMIVDDKMKKTIWAHKWTNDTRSAWEMFQAYLRGGIESAGG